MWVGVFVLDDFHKNDKDLYRDSPTLCEGLPCVGRLRKSFDKTHIRISLLEDLAKVISLCVGLWV